MTFFTIARDAAIAIAPFALTAATGLLGKATQYALHAVSGIKNKAVRDGLDWAINEAQSVVQNTVVAANQQIVSGLKASGQWTTTEASRVFQSVLAKTEASLSAQAKAILTQELPDLPSFLGTLIEAHVAVAPNKTHVAAKAKAPAKADPAPANPA